MTTDSFEHLSSQPSHPRGGRGSLSLSISLENPEERLHSFVLPAHSRPQPPIHGAKRKGNNFTKTAIRISFLWLGWGGGGRGELGTVIGSSSRATQNQGAVTQGKQGVIIRIWRKGMLGRQKTKQNKTLKTQNNNNNKKPRQPKRYLYHYHHHFYYHPQHY